MASQRALVSLRSQSAGSKLYQDGPLVIFDLSTRLNYRLLGWIYTLSWSLSFYPQPILNLRRRSTIGTTPSFPTLNVLGFSCYTLSTTLFYYSPVIKAQYALRNNGSPTTVRGNDVAFAMHALVMSIIGLSQFWSWLWGFEGGGSRAGGRVGRGVWIIVGGCLLSVAWVVWEVWMDESGGYRSPSPPHHVVVGWEWIDVVYAVGYVKLVVTVVKYIPQAWANYKRKSTEGWSIWQILMDLLGGVLSIAQLVIDCSLQKDWSGISGNPVKLMLGNVSIFFDFVFMTQHYILYRGGKAEEEALDEEERGMSATDEDEPAAAGSDLHRS